MKERMFRVICLNVSGHSNKIFKHNDVVPESSFLKGHADKYVKSQHLEEVLDEVKKETPLVPEQPLTPEEPKVVTPPTETSKPPKKKK